MTVELAPTPSVPVSNILIRGAPVDVEKTPQIAKEIEEKLLIAEKKNDKIEIESSNSDSSSSDDDI